MRENEKSDKRVIKEIIKELENYDHLITYYGTYFDIPFIKTRALLHNLTSFPSLLHTDLWFIIRYNYKLHSNSLMSACAHLDIEGKTHIEPAKWTLAMRGDRKSIQSILSHNRGDVVITEQLYNQVKHEIKLIKRL